MPEGAGVVPLVPGECDAKTIAVAAPATTSRPAMAISIHFVVAPIAAFEAEPGSPASCVGEADPAICGRGPWTLGTPLSDGVP